MSEVSQNDVVTHPVRPPLWVAVLLPAMAGAMGWGIRGQYGHGTGAMIAGVLCGLTIVMLFGRHLSRLAGARSAALFTIAISFGGSMTYGQTVGLTHDEPLIGNYGALAWGMLGLALKGGIWIGFAGLFLGTGLSGVRYRCGELALLMWVGVFLFFLGIFVCNQPYDPENRLLPAIYFSDHWHWEPDAELTPRRELWGGLLFALMGSFAYIGVFKRDVLACRIGMWAVLAGMSGFPAGQCAQACHAWNPAWFGHSFFAHFNWWNMMEITFGAVFGAVLALGIWRNWDSIKMGADQPEASGGPQLSLSVEITLLVVHCAAVLVWNLGTFPMFGNFAGLALTMGVLPVVAISGGRLWPCLMLFPVALLPIAAKTVREIAVKSNEMPLSTAIGVLLFVPMGLAFAAVAVFAKGDSRGGTRSTQAFAAAGLILATWTFFCLNWVFFRNPWPWADWTGRTPSGIIFAVCAFGLTIGAVWVWACSRVASSAEPPSAA